MEAIKTLGTIIDDTSQRDAIHVAVAPVIAGCRLLPGAHVGVCDGQAGTYHLPFIGIVDPFLKQTVEAGEMFWIFLYPGSITSLRHVWTHPTLPDSNQSVPVTVRNPSKEASEKWLRDFCDRSECPSYERLIALALDFEGGEYMTVYGTDASGEIPPEFWDHVEIVTGEKIPVGRRASWFSCSC